ncbi:ATP-binding protein [Kitasatospora sp. NPDC058243]|uniref:nSTAND1 domain-containing NTPase n=1 Tax=Kitasatospora sp. NPDC058243 TaxID=3346397 RepID=UPI0036DD9FD8
MGSEDSVGVGFVVGDRRIITCAHVVNAAVNRDKAVRDRPADGLRIQIDFPLVGDSEGAPLRSCKVEAWDPPPGQGAAGRDVAGLVLVGGDTLPMGAGPARLVDHGTVRDVKASVFGYPGNPPGRTNGGWSRCVLRGAIGGGLIQLDTELEAALRTQPGYSGSPAVITDEFGDAVVGMVAVAGRDGTAGDAYAVPSTHLVAAWPQELGSSILPPCPYRGLQSFSAADARRGLFVGREEEVSRLRSMVRVKPVVAVVGPSGVGKSSVVSAGLWPTLVNDGWLVASFRPGVAPFDAVARALLELERPAGSHSLDDLVARSAQLRREGFWRVASQVALLTGRRIALLGDQFEEVFTNRTDGGGYIEFLERMLPPLDGPEAVGDVRLICTLRADFLPDLLALSDIGPRLQDRQLNVSPLDVDALSRVIVEPAKTAGVTYVPGLAEAIARDASRGPGGLPLLEFALTELWPHQRSRRMSFDSYYQLGGVSGALNQHAETVYSSVRESFDESRIRRVLMAMTRARGGASSAVRVVAQREHLGVDWEVAQALAHAEHRLVVIGPEGHGSAEIAHEALIREWSRLANWVDEDAEFQRWLAVMEERAAEAELLSETRVTEAQRWLAERDTDIPEEITHLVARSQSAIIARRATEERLDKSERLTQQLVEQHRQLQEASWKDRNLARISGMLQGRRDLEATATIVLYEVAPVMAASYGSFYLAQEVNRSITEMIVGYDEKENSTLRLIANYGHAPVGADPAAHSGEAVVNEGATLRSTVVRDVPPGILTRSAELGSVSAHVAAVPIQHEGRLLGLLEVAAAKPFSAVALEFLNEIADVVGTTVHTISVNTKTEGLLLESQRLTAELAVRSAELEARQEELELTNDELQEKAEQLAQQNRAIEIKNSEIEEARRILEERAEQLALASQYKSEFLANMSHELRTPLNSMLILAKLLSDNTEGNLSPRQVEFAETIWGGGSDLLQLISDILDLSKVEAGKMDVDPSRVDLGPIGDSLRATFQPLTAEKRLDFAVLVSQDLPAAVHTDGRRLQQVLRNLISNAVKFTDSGVIRLAVDLAGPATPQSIRSRLLEAGAITDFDEPLIAFAVSDTGIGIPGDRLEDIFEAFAQGVHSSIRRYGGTGLGLSISREIAQLIGGEIHVESKVGVGSTFTLYLPLAPLADRLDGSVSVAGVQHPAEAEALFSTRYRPLESSAGRDAAFRGEQILVVDDDIRSVFALVSMLERQGLSLFYAEDGREALDILRDHRDIMLVIIGTRLPGMDGCATIDAIRRQPHVAHLPVIALTAEAMKGDKERILAAGADAYITKPIVGDGLMEAISRFLSCRRPGVTRAPVCDVGSDGPEPSLH